MLRDVGLDLLNLRLVGPRAALLHGLGAQCNKRVLHVPVPVYYAPQNKRLKRLASVLQLAETIGSVAKPLQLALAKSQLQSRCIWLSQ
jgi:hypothetical protein